jgi:hypothetical protein
MHRRLSTRLAIGASAALIAGTLFSGSAFGQATATPGPGTPAATATPGPGTPVVTTTAAATTTAVATTTPAPTTATPTAQPAATATPAAIAHDERYFSQTGFRIDNDVVWDYFLRRGAVTTFGYPVSRTFMFRGVPAQFFQRRIVEIGPDGKARQANLLDPELMPYTKINGATFPGPDPAVQGAAPAATDAPATLAFVQRMAPDQFGGRPVNFHQTFANMVPFQVAFPGGGSPSLLPGIELEMWGVPISNPAADPNNANFVYQRWQRGIMHYRVECNCTEAILLADYLKSILTGQNLPSDLDQQSQGSRFYKQYDSTKSGWVRDPNLLPNTDMTNAFTPG